MFGLRRSGLRYHEVADVLQVNPNSVGQLINRALRRFAETYESLFAGRQETTQDDEKAAQTRRK
jgi:DNA-directed RNA polymerase specialized sigma24 family protein